MSTLFTIGPNGVTNPPNRPWIYDPGRTHELVTLVNIGPNVAYLDEAVLPGAGNGIPLAVGSTLPWDKDLALFATSPLGATIVVSPNGSTPFDPGAIASQLITQGLPALIASAIYGLGIPGTVVTTRFDNSATPDTLTNGTSTGPYPIDFGTDGYFTLSADITPSVVTASFTDLSECGFDLTWFVDAAGTEVFKGNGNCSSLRRRHERWPMCSMCRRSWSVVSASQDTCR